MFVQGFTADEVQADCDLRLPACVVVSIGLMAEAIHRTKQQISAKLLMLPAFTAFQCAATDSR